MQAISTLTLAVAIGLSTPLAMAVDEGHSSHSVATSSEPSTAVAVAVAVAASASAQAEMSEGVVRKVNKDAQKITIRHGELKNLDMPPMTMVFRVKDPAFLDKVKTGDEIHFVAEKVEGQFTVTQLDVKN